MADQLRPYIDGSAGLVDEEDNLEEEADDGVPLLTVSDINPDMLQVSYNTYKKLGRAKLLSLLLLRVHRLCKVPLGDVVGLASLSAVSYKGGNKFLRSKQKPFGHRASIPASSIPPTSSHNFIV